MMTGLLMCGNCTEMRSSRRLERATHENVAVRLLTGGCHPDHTVIAEFRRVHLVSLTGLFLQILRLCQKAGIVKLGRVALDGTKVKANASLHKAMSYSRMLREEEELSAEIAAMLRKIEADDKAEDSALGRSRRGG
jgi:transposase